MSKSSILRLLPHSCLFGAFADMVPSSIRRDTQTLAQMLVKRARASAANEPLARVDTSAGGVPPASPKRTVEGDPLVDVDASVGKGPPARATEPSSDNPLADAPESLPAL